MIFNSSRPLPVHLCVLVCSTTGTSHEGVPDGELVSLPGNDRCADCSEPDVSWASVNLGLLLCIRCSGAHRSLGVDVSKVRSTKLDSWTPEMVEEVRAIGGNDKANAVFEARLGAFPDDTRPSKDATQEELQAWVSAKCMDLDTSQFIRNPHL